MYYKKELDAITKVGQYRQRLIYDENLIDVASNDYLGLSLNKDILTKAYKRVLKYSSNSSKSSMLVNGYHPLHKKFERKLSKLNKFEDAIILGSGFLANIAMIESMVRKNDILFIDEEYHASGILATKLVSGQVVKFKHNNYNDLSHKIKKAKKYTRIIIAIEGVYSMNGNIAPKEFSTIANKYDALLIVDEAHSSGVIGDNLLGWYDYWKIQPKKNHIKMGTLGKAYGSYGAYILGSKHIIDFLTNRAKSIIYTTAPSLMDTALALEGFKYIMKHKKKLKRNIEKKQDIVYEILSIKTQSLIVPILVHNNQETLKIQSQLKEHKYIVGAIRKPTVEIPMLRVIIKLDVSNEDIKKLCKSIIQRLIIDV